MNIVLTLKKTEAENRVVKNLVVIKYLGEREIELLRVMCAS